MFRQLFHLIIIISILLPMTCLGATSSESDSTIYTEGGAVIRKIDPTKTSKVVRNWVSHPEIGFTALSGPQFHTTYCGVIKEKQWIGLTSSFGMSIEPSIMRIGFGLFYEYAPLRKKVITLSIGGEAGWWSNITDEELDSWFGGPKISARWLNNSYVGFRTAVTGMFGRSGFTPRTEVGIVINPQ